MARPRMVLFRNRAGSGERAVAHPVVSSLLNWRKQLRSFLGFGLGSEEMMGFRVLEL